MNYGCCTIGVDVRKVVIEGMACQLPSSFLSLEKTIGASPIALWCVLSSLFFVEKTKLHNILPSQVIMSVPKKSIPSAVVIHYCTWYTFFRNRYQSVFLKKRLAFFWCQIDFQIICNLFWHNHFLIRCHRKGLLYRLQVSLGPDLGSGVPILMAADKPCPLLQPSLCNFKVVNIKTSLRLSDQKYCTHKLVLMFDLTIVKF